MKREFPFSPKSNAKLLPGDFWGITLDSGRFACGRVIELPPKGFPGSKTMFLAGLLDWIGNELPTFDSIAGAKIIKQGDAHILTITNHKALILGNRSLELDNIEALICKDPNGFRKGYSFIEFKPKKNTEEFPRFTTWGYSVIKILADKYLDKKDFSEV